MPFPSWLEQAVFYQIYPPSFYDANGDGIGDLPGIIAKLDYLQDLGVNALWLNPCFVSPFQDGGYDISDYYQVAPRYGTNEDLRRLFIEADRRGIRVLLDLVPGHTSVEHPWFKESAKHERNRYSDWYIWTDSVWTPPVPGLSMVRGYGERDGCYIANFFFCQPALNYGFATPDPAQPWQQPVDAPGPRAVREEMKRIMKFWLDQGAGGFRVDMAGSLVKGDPGGRETGRFWQEIRAWLDEEYPEACLVSEWGCPSRALTAGFHMDFMLPFGMAGYNSLFRKESGSGLGCDPYGWSFFHRLGYGNIREFLDPYLEEYERTKGIGFIAIPSGNHDISPRLGKNRDEDDLAVVFLFLLTMPGPPFIYYGDEIGLRGVEGLPSKEGGYGRTEARTPMQWDDGPNAGFSAAPAERLYLPVEPGPHRPNVAAQARRAGSLLDRVRCLIRLRKGHPALWAGGGFAPVHAVAGDPLFAYRRWSQEEDLLIALNPAARPAEAVLPAGLSAAPPAALYGPEDVFTAGEGGAWRLRLPAVSGGVYRIYPSGGR